MRLQPLNLGNYLAAAGSEVVRRHGEGEAQPVRAVVPGGRQVPQVGLVRLQPGARGQIGSLHVIYASASFMMVQVFGPS